MFKSLSRRSFFKTAAAAPCVISNVGPAIAKSELFPYSLSGGGNVGSEPFYWGNDSGSVVVPTKDPNWVKNTLQNTIAERASQARRVARFQDYQSVHRLDPDLHDAKSFSNAAKIRMQAERDVARENVDILSKLDTYIDDPKSRLGLS
jgi:uncharacterized protein (DUF1501 family)